MSSEKRSRVLRSRNSLTNAFCAGYLMALSGCLTRPLLVKENCMRIDEMDTPFLAINLDALEENLERYHGYFEKNGIGFRPHIKTHKTLAVAHMQLKYGAIGLTCQKLGEAEVLAAGGIHTDLLIPYNIMGAQKLDRLTALAKRLPITLAPDSEYTVRGLSRAAASEDVSIGILIEVEMGFERTGVPHAPGGHGAGEARPRSSRAGAQGIHGLSDAARFEAADSGDD